MVEFSSLGFGLFFFLTKIGLFSLGINLKAYLVVAGDEPEIQGLCLHSKI